MFEENLCSVKKAKIDMMTWIQCAAKCPFLFYLLLSVKFSVCQGSSVEQTLLYIIPVQAATIAVSTMEDVHTCALRNLLAMCVPVLTYLTAHLALLVRNLPILLFFFPSFFFSFWSPARTLGITVLARFLPMWPWSGLVGSHSLSWEKCCSDDNLTVKLSNTFCQL